MSGVRSTDDDACNESEALARRAQQRDPVAWSTLFERHYRTVYSFVRYRLRGPDEAEDIASQVFETAYRNADRFDYRGVPVEAWLIGIARNLTRDQVKKLGRRGIAATLEEDTVMVAATDDVSVVEVQQDLARAFESLTEDQRTVLTLRFLQDRAVDDTAHLMQRSEDAVKNLQRRALGALQRALAGTAYDPGVSS